MRVYFYKNKFNYVAFSLKFDNFECVLPNTQKNCIRLGVSLIVSFNYVYLIKRGFECKSMTNKSISVR